MGTTGIVAQKFGEKDFNEILLSFFRSLTIAILIGIFFITFKEKTLNLAIYIFNPSEKLQPLLKIYFFTRVFALLPGLINMVFLGWFFGCFFTGGGVRSFLIIGFGVVFGVSFFSSGKIKLCHTLNGSSLALPRIFSTIIETFQKKNFIEI